MSPTSSESKKKPNKKQRERVLVVTCFHGGFLSAFFFDPEDGGDMFLRRCYIPGDITLPNNRCEKRKYHPDV
jgi:hypothetical protein